ncbi:MAG: nucleotidyltransferase family protein [Kiritimatiellia bacterium]
MDRRGASPVAVGESSRPGPRGVASGNPPVGGRAAAGEPGLRLGTDGPALPRPMPGALFHQRLLSGGDHSVACLESAGIPCLCFRRGPLRRGLPVSGSGGPALPGSDPLVPREHARRALRIFQEAGYRLHQPHMAGYFLRNHLHWMLARARDGVVCDLHWAVEHRFRPYQSISPPSSPVPGGGVAGLAWREPGSEHAFLLAAPHACKHQPAVFDPLTLECSSPCCLFQWLDLALLARKPLDAARIARHAAEWRIEPVAGLAVRVLRDALGVAVPGPVAQLESFASAATRALPA